MSRHHARTPAFTVSRRVLIGAASAAPLLAEAGKGLGATEAVRRCDEWLALDADVDRLVRRWSDLEGLLIEQKRWGSLSPNERLDIQHTEEMDQIDDRLASMFDQRRELLESLPRLPALNMEGVTRKLLVVLKMMQHERGDYFDLFSSAVSEIATARCPGCGAPVAPPSALSLLGA